MFQNESKRLVLGTLLCQQGNPSPGFESQDGTTLNVYYSFRPYSNFETCRRTQGEAENGTYLWF